MTRATCLLASALVLVALLVGSLRAETILALPNSKATLTLGDGWNRVKHTYKGIVEIFKHEGGSILVVTRADVPNPDAWIAEKKQAYVDKVEAGIKVGVPGYKRLAKKIVDANGVPALDLETKRDGGSTVVIRVLLFRTYSVSAGIEVPKGGDLTMARAVLKTLAPPKDPPKESQPTEPPKTAPPKTDPPKKSG